jgi:ATP-dependent Zn protease
MAGKKQEEQVAAPDRTKRVATHEAGHAIAVRSMGHTVGTKLGRS